MPKIAFKMPKAEKLEQIIVMAETDKTSREEFEFACSFFGIETSQLKRALMVEND